ncbi:MAG: NAD(+)/NADH kinase [Faecalibacterium sp.]|nr:NAD(+)/NADH kinase [Faecalibacterium sp.]
MKVYIAPNPKRPVALAAVPKATAILRQHQVEVLLDESLKPVCTVPDVTYLDNKQCHLQADAVLTIGGDGTILREAGVAFHYKKPIMGINLGRYGFLAICEEDEMEEKLALLAAGKYSLDTRILLSAHIADDPDFCVHALNDIVVAKGHLNQAIEFNIFCDGILVEHYRGDGVIVATPTGSTAYSLAAGGPILDARTKAMVVTPISPHSLQTSSMVFAPERKIALQVGTLQEGETAYLSNDGHDGIPLQSGMMVEIALSHHTVQLITFGAADQFQAIDQKLKNRS